MIRVVMRGRKESVMAFRRRRGGRRRFGKKRRIVNRKRRVAPRRVGFRL